MNLARRAAAVFVGGLILHCSAPLPVALAQPSKAPVQSASGKIDLRPKLKVGQEVRFKMDEDASGPQGIPGGETQNLKQTVGATVLLKCIDTNPETGSTLDIVFESFKISIRGGGANVDFDSSKPAKANDPTDSIFRSLLGMHLTAKMGTDGNITSIDGGGGGMGDVGEMLSGADIMKSMFGNLSTSKKGTGLVSVGEKWTNEDSMGAAMGNVRITTTNTLKSVMGGMANIDVKGVFSLDPSSSGKVSIHDSSMTGEVKWDTETGMIDSMQMKQHLTVQQKQDKGPPTQTTQDSNVRVQRLRGSGHASDPSPVPPPTQPAKKPPKNTPKDPDFGDK